MLFISILAPNSTIVTVQEKAFNFYIKSNSDQH